MLPSLFFKVDPTLSTTQTTPTDGLDSLVFANFFTTSIAPKLHSQPSLQSLQEIYTQAQIHLSDELHVRRVQVTSILRSRIKSIVHVSLSASVLNQLLFANLSTRKDSIENLFLLLLHPDSDPNHSFGFSKSSLLLSALQWHFLLSARILAVHPKIDCTAISTSLFYSMNRGLFFAASSNDLPLLQEILARDPSQLNRAYITSRGNQKMKSTALSLALDGGHYEVSAYLLNRPDIDVTEPDQSINDHFSYLHHTIKYGFIDLCQILMTKGYPINSYNRHHTPLCEAVIMKRTALVTLLLRHPSIDPNLSAPPPSNPFLYHTPLSLSLRLPNSSLEASKNALRKDLHLFKSLASHPKTNFLWPHNSFFEMVRNIFVSHPIEYLEILLANISFDLYVRILTLYHKEPFKHGDILIRDFFLKEELLGRFKRQTEKEKEILYQKHMAASGSRLFALIVYLCDDFFRLTDASAEESEPNKLARRFFAISKKLPIELQMVISNRARYSSKDLILSDEVEEGLCQVLELETNPFK